MHAWDAPPRVVAHRGSPFEAPENTLASFQAAAQAGARAFELDARLTADGHVVVIHDGLRGRTVAGEGAVEEATLEEVRRWDAGTWFDRAFAGARVPTLDEVLTAFPSTLLDIELKADAVNAEGLPAAVHAVVAKRRAVGRVVVTSFDPALASAYAARDPEARAGAILAFEPDDADAREWPDLAWVAVNAGATSDAGLRLLAAAGKRVMAWTVNDEEDARRLHRAGVASIITDRPGRLLRAFPEDAAGP